MKVMGTKKRHLREARTTNKDNLQSPPAEEFSFEGIRKELRSGAWQHPLTKYPFAVGAVMLGYAFLVAPYLGAFLPTFSLGLGAGTIGLGNFWWRLSHVSRQYERRVQALAEQQIQERERAEMARLEDVRRELEAGFVRLGSHEGNQALVELVNEYKGLGELLEDSREDRLLSVARVGVLAKETYAQGLNVLSCALDLMRAVQPSNLGGLRVAIVELESEIASLEIGGAQEELIKIKEASVASHLERLKRLEDQNLRIAELLHQSDNCEGVLLTTRLDLVKLRAESSEEGINEVVRRLQRTIDMEIEIQQALKGSEDVSA